MNGYPYNQNYGGPPQWNYPPPPMPEPAQQKNTMLVPVIIVLSVILLVLVGIVFWMFTSRDGQTEPVSETAPAPIPVVTEAAAPSSVEAPDTTIQVPGTTTYVETVTETQQSYSGSSAGSSSGSSSGSGSGGYGAGLQIRERCWNSTSASAIFRGAGTAKCNFIARVGNQLAGVRASGYRNLNVTSPNTGENIRLSCEQVQDSNLTQLWRCTTHHGSRLYVYP